VHGYDGNEVDLNPGKVSLPRQKYISQTCFVFGQIACVDRCCVYVWNEWCIFEDALLEDKS